MIKNVKDTTASSSVIKALLRNETEFKIKEVLKKKGNKLSFKWKRCDSPFKSWTDKFDIL